MIDQYRIVRRDMDREEEKTYRNELKQIIKNIERDYVTGEETDELYSGYDNIFASEYKIARSVANFILSHPEFTDKDIKDIIGKRLERFQFIKEMYKAEPNLVEAIRQNSFETVLKKLDKLREKTQEINENKIN